MTYSKLRQSESRGVRWITWNVNGWKDTLTTKRKLGKIKNIVSEYDGVILLETHTCKEDEKRIESMGKHWSYFWNHGEDSSRCGVLIMTKNKTIQKEDIDYSKDMGDRQYT